ncbi:MAG: DUF4145 domain-containing protein [Candidatus Thiodiazotropha lotti]|uniref:DUF4145 domain-containing protein n=1 Tax=Candidatus Thiodiazotropha lotti TaxID=2792787 RepID=A0A9E4N1E1_9GAMM|nr:DUF4145 domain-containing protein [Candidatus Thiodiazotropha lotti]MCW4205926.1 DUF4145 domain-containing protein [Candidatus Thiodiazotropha lotti]
MAQINHLGNVTASCPGCRGSTSTFEHIYQGGELGVVKSKAPKPYSRMGEEVDVHFRLFRCAGCGRGAIGCVLMRSERANYPNDISKLVWFEPESKERLPLPKDTPKGIVSEFREGELCMENNALRAAAGMFRSVLDKTMRANGYKTKRGTPLAAQIDDAANDGVITASRQRRAHDEVRVLGNDVLHDEWHEIPEEDVQAARYYTQRILEDFYDDRESVLNLLRESGKVPDEDRQAEEET